MYHKNKIQRWIDEGEGPMLDFKRTINSPSKIARSMVAFANARGGKIVVGVEDNGLVLGIDPDGEEYEMDIACDDFCDPPVDMEYERYETHGKMILIAHVYESDEKPHFAIDKKGRRRMYVRINDECVVPNGMIEEMVRSGNMNYLHRNQAYGQLKVDLIRYLRQQNKIDVSQFADWQKCSDKSAKRTLLDLLFEGVLRFDSAKELFVLNEQSPAVYKLKTR